MFKNLKFNIENSENGFTLVELIASTFVLISILSVFALLTSSLSSTSLIRDNLIASNLAQEGIEVARNMRDRDWFLGNSFGASLPNGSWLVQWNSTSLIPLGANPVLKKDSASGIFSYDTGNNTPFQRTVATSLLSANELRVVSTVSWYFKGSIKSVSAEAHLFNWFKP